MPGEVINLRRARKRLARAASAEAAQANRVAFGIAKPERQHAKAEAALADRRLSGHRRADEPGDSG